MGTSPLDRLKARKLQLAVEMEAMVIPIPRWSDPAVYLRIRPLEGKAIDRIMGPVEKAGRRTKSETLLNALAAVVAAATVKVLVGDEDDPEGQAEVDLPDMRESLEVAPDADSVTTVRALILTDGDVIKVANKVIDHSGFGDQRIDEVLAGN